MNHQPGPSPDDTASQALTFPVVGVGASAGGLEAFTQLLRHLPAPAGLALVLVQHLDPHQQSLLTEILNRESPLPVVEARDGTHIERDRVYVIPANTVLTIERGCLRLGPRPPSGLFMPIDIMLRSLARDAGSRAVAVILSGNGTDGAIGLEDIKGANGIAFAQDEQTAPAASMPRSAVATGYVDFVLPPNEIAKELLRLASGWLARDEPPEVETDPDDSQSLSGIFRLLRSACGIDFSQYKQTTIKRRIYRRMGLRGVERLSEYAWMLQEDAAELYALQQDCLIRVTSFFRDPASFESLKTAVFPALSRNRRPGTPLRIWVAGCSTGEEVYSLAIALIESLGDMVTNTPIKILATDVNEAAIERARAGTYVDNIALDVSAERLRRFFTKVNGSYQISKAIRDLCVFSRHNVTRDTPFANLDLISCRNLMIYLDASLQKRVIPYFHYGLRSSAYLMLGASETIGSFTELFDVVDKDNRIYRKRPVHHRIGIDFPVADGPYFVPRQMAEADSMAETDAHDQEREIERMLAYRFAPPVLIVDQHLSVIKLHARRAASAWHANCDVSPELLRLARDQLMLELREAIESVKRQKTPVRRDDLEIDDGQRKRRVAVDVLPLKSTPTGQSTFAIVIEEQSDASSAPPTAVSYDTTDHALVERVQKLERLLDTAREQMQSIVEENEATNEELKAANEEILSSNEELQSTNEELQTAKEEMQSTNEELATVNEELTHRNQELGQLNNDLLNLFGSISYPVILVSREMRIRRFTTPAEPLFNLIPSDVGRPITHLQPNIVLPDLPAMVARVVDSFASVEEEVQDKQGRWYALRIRPYVTAENHIDGAAISLLDIDAIKRSAEHLRASRDNAEAIVETVWEPLLVLDQNLSIRRANAAFYRTFGLPQGFVEGKRLSELPEFPVAEGPLLDKLQEVLAENKRIHDLELPLKLKGGVKDLLISAHRIFWEGSGTQMILLAIEDVTSRKREIEQAKLLAYEQAARAEAEQANRTKDEFLAMLAHELRNPLAPVRNTLSILRHRLSGDEVAGHALSISERQIAHMSRLLDDLLDLSRITRGKIRLQKELVCVQTALERAVEGTRGALEMRQHRLELDLPQERLYLEADPARLEQIFSNLLQNASKYTDPGGTIRLSAHREDADVCIRVTDTGIGISPELLPHIFDLFTQADHSLDHSQGGLGIGLTLVRRLVTLHGGHVEAFSEGAGRGSTFVVTLPLLQRAHAAPEAFAPAPAGAVAGLRVLVVDDNADAAGTLVTLLQHWGHRPSVAYSGDEAVSLAADQAPDIVLLDIGLPGASGYEVAKTLRQKVGLRDALLVATTGYGKDEDRRQSADAGIDHHLVKPVDPQELALLINEYARARPRN